MQKRRRFNQHQLEDFLNEEIDGQKFLEKCRVMSIGKEVYGNISEALEASYECVTAIKGELNGLLEDSPDKRLLIKY